MRRLLIGVPLALAALALGSASASACGCSYGYGYGYGYAAYGYAAPPAYGYYAAPRLMATPRRRTGLRLLRGASIQLLCTAHQPTPTRRRTDTATDPGLTGTATDPGLTAVVAGRQVRSRYGYAGWRRWSGWYPPWIAPLRARPFSHHRRRTHSARHRTGGPPAPRVNSN